MSFLDEVRVQKQIEVAALRSGGANRQLERRGPAGIRDFGAALGGGEALIAEVKHRSPSSPQFRQDAAPEILARGYQRCGAAALSIVTDRANFGTSLDDVPAMRRATSLPVLVKDFVIAPEQIRAAWSAGADAILLIARMLDEGELGEFHAYADSLGLAALVECHDQEDVDKALAACARIIGINNRNLATLTTDLVQTPRLLQAIPEDVLRVCESGIGRREQILRFADLGADAFLVGHALLQSPDPGRKVRQLLGHESETGRRIKVCGLTGVEDAVRAWDLGADLLGLIFAPSPRQVTVNQVREIRRALPRARLCGVFVDEDPAVIARCAETCDLDLIQLHGAESPEYCRGLKRSVGLPLIKALTPDQVTAGTVADYDTVAAFLVDPPKGAPAAGVAVDPDLLTAADRIIEAGGEVLLAGGLAPGRLEALRGRTDLGLDVCRGVEAEPGRKDHQRLQAFMAEVAS